LLGYFAIFSILYDIWSYHKTLLRDAIPLRLFAISSSLLMFIASLVPPFYYLVNHFSVKLLLHYSSYPILADRGLTVARTFVYILINCSHLLDACNFGSQRTISTPTSGAKTPGALFDYRYSHEQVHPDNSDDAFSIHMKLSAVSIIDYAAVSRLIRS